jgi:plasmid stabilization system protein ParE
MPILKYRAAALRDLADIADFIATDSGSRDVAEAFIDRLINHLEHIARRPTIMGRARPELRPGYRSILFGTYVILMRYGDDDAPRSHLYIGNIIRGSRDLDAYFANFSDED